MRNKTQQCAVHRSSSVQAAENRYLEVYAGKLEALTKTGGMGGCYGHLKGGEGCEIIWWEACSTSGTRMEARRDP